jgi:hypothetical protein
MPVYAQPNMILYSGYDLMARAIAGDNVVNGMYFEFTNNAGFTPDPISMDRTAAYYAALSGTEGYIRNTTASRCPVYQASAPTYNHNRVTFLGIADQAAESSGAEVVDNTSRFYSAALVSIPDFDDKSKDVLFSAGLLTAELTKPANANIGVRWTIEFRD